MATMAVGGYQTACEASPHKVQIDNWLNENKAAAWISKELKKQYGEYISDKAILKYKKYREEFIQNDLEKDPIYVAKVNTLNQHLVDGIGKIREVDVIGKLADVIEDSANLLADAKNDNVRIRTVQDMRFVSMTMLDAIKLYGDTVMKAQRFQKVEEDPSLLRNQTININVKSALTDVLKEVMGNGSDGYNLIDKLRNGISMNNQDIIDVDPVKSEDSGGDNDE